MSKMDINTFYLPKKATKKKTTKKQTQEIKCCFENCSNGYGEYGHNPAPFKFGANARCCDTCNETLVIPRRIKELIKDEEKEEEEFDVLCGTCMNGGQYEDGSWDDNHERCDDCNSIVCFKKDKYENDEDGNLYCKYCI